MINVQQLKKLLGSKSPKTAVILGSGLGSLGDEIQNPLIIPYQDIEGFPKSTVSGHRGQLIIGELNGCEVLCLQGRFHLYEGHQPIVIAEVIHALKSIGIEKLIVTNAAGSLNPNFAPGEIMLISDHINFSGRNPLVGPNNNEMGPRFVDMSNAYDRDLRQKMRQIAEREKITLHEGVYLMVLGPNFETAAEIKAFRTLGADTVGMSTVPEVIAAAHCGIKVVAISAITNFGTGMQTSPLSHDETLQEAAKASDALTKLVKNFLTEK